MPKAELFIRFPDQSKAFTYGVEYGRIWAQMERGDDVASNSGFPVRLENVELLKDTCIKYGYIPHFGRQYYNEVIEFTAIKSHATNN